MKATLILAAAASVVVAQNFSGIPPCATSCLAAAISAKGCAPNDVGCQCGLDPLAVAPCLLGSSGCSPDDVGKAAANGQALCSQYSLTRGGATPTGSNSASTTTTGSGSTSVTSAPTTGQTTAPPTTSPPSSSTRASNGTFTMSSTTTSRPPSSTPNAAATPVAFGIGALAAFIGAIAAL